METYTSGIERFFTKRRPLWVRLVVNLMLLLLPFAAAYLDGVLDEFLRQGRWRVFSLAPIIILYIWFVAPVISRSESEVVRSIRRLVPLDDENFKRLVDRESRVDPRNEWLAIGLGAILGIVSAKASGIDEDASWLMFYWFISIVCMYGLLAWAILGAAVSTRLNNAFHRQELRIDILDLTPLETIGRQSLLLALVFIGGITLSQLLSFQSENLSSLSFWLTYLLLVFAIILIFFLNMRPTHETLSAAKLRELEPLQRQINASCRELLRRLDQNQDSGDLPEKINALVAYEQRLQATRTWPYNTTMLRTLFFSVFIPLGSVIARLLIEVFFQ